MRALYGTRLCRRTIRSEGGVAHSTGRLSIAATCPHRADASSLTTAIDYDGPADGTAAVSGSRRHRGLASVGADRVIRHAVSPHRHKPRLAPVVLERSIDDDGLRAEPSEPLYFYRNLPIFRIIRPVIIAIRPSPLLIRNAFRAGGASVVANGARP